MDAWGSYKERLEQIGCPKREMWMNHTMTSLRRRMMDSLSTHLVTMNGEEQYISVVHTQKRNQKRICSLPGEHIQHGGIIEFADNKWLVVEKDADNEIYDKGLMQQCNHILRWISKDGTLKEKWCFIEDGTKYLTGEYREDVMTIGDARVAMVIGKDKDTVELARGLRFLIDDSDSDDVMAYEITKTNKLYNSFNNEGVFKFILSEVPLIDEDNTDLRIADYTKWKPARELDSDHKNSDYTVAEIVEAAREEAAIPPQDDKKVWL